MFGKSKAVTMSLRTVILVSICLQNAGYTLLRKYSTSHENVSSKEILFVGEVIKVLVAIWFTLSDTEKSDAQGVGLQKLVWLVTHSWKMLFLAGIYAAMNILSFVALQYIGAGEFTICAQLKILTTAGFSVAILGTSLTDTKWRALTLLVLGCILVASPNITSSHSDSENMSQFFGYSAVLTEVVLSGFASIYFEKVVKSTSEVVTIWERNFQLSVYSLLMYGIFIFHDSSDTTRVPWSNWSTITLLVSVLGAAGGLLVAATLKYADSILKTMATAGAIVISTVVGHLLLNGPMDLIIAIGAMVTILAICNYSFDATPSSLSSIKSSPETTSSKV